MAKTKSKSKPAKKKGRNAPSAEEVNIPAVDATPETEQIGDVEPNYDAEMTNEVTSIPDVETVESTASATVKKSRRAKKPQKEKKLSAVDAAAQVLASKGKPMNCPQMIEAMTAQGLWSSPNGKTPHATLYSAILREINTKGNASRFKKSERGQFIAREAN